MAKSATMGLRLQLEVILANYGVRMAIGGHNCKI